MREDGSIIFILNKLLTNQRTAVKHSIKPMAERLQLFLLEKIT